MERKITLSFWNPPKEETEKEQKPEEVILYGQGAGLYSCLNFLAEKMSQKDFDHKGFEVHQ